MAKKRKSENAGLDEVERTLYTSFCTAANSISQLYTQTQHQQKLAFQAGERHAVEKLYTWLQQSGSNPSCVDILNYLKNELDGEDLTMSPGPQFHNQMTPQQQLSLQQHQHQPSNVQTLANAGGVSGFAHLGRMGTGVDQSKVSVFTGALSSPNRRCLPPFGITQGLYGLANNSSLTRRSVVGVEPLNEVPCEERESTAPAQNATFTASSDQLHNQSAGAVYDYNQAPPSQHRETQPFTENDSCMDMHSDGMYQHSFYR